VTKHLANRVIECSTGGRRAGRYRVLFDSDGDAVRVETILSPVSKRKLWSVADDKEPSITACCAIRAAIASSQPASASIKFGDA
jgi:hypothetical protein